MTHGSLFSGIGGFDLGAKWAGIETVWQCEKDPYCRKVLQKHFPETILYQDIKEMVNEEIPAVDIISGGFPCQPFSQAGKRSGQADDRWLWPEMVSIIKKVRPRWIIGENVPGIVNMALDTVLVSLEDTGYTCQTISLPACGLNAPHKRQRIFIVAHAYGMRCSTRCTLTGREEGGVIDGRCREIRSSMAHTHGKYGEMHKRWDQFQKTFGKGASGRSSGNHGGIWEVEPGVGRVVDGIPRRVDRLRVLGNAVVPQICYLFFRAIKILDNYFLERRETNKKGGYRCSLGDQKKVENPV